MPTNVVKLGREESNEGLPGVFSGEAVVFLALMRPACLVGVAGRVQGIREAAASGPPAEGRAADPCKDHGPVRSGDRFDPVRVFGFVKAHRGRYPVPRMCRVLDVSASGRSAWLTSPPSRRDGNRQLSQPIVRIHAESPNCLWFTAAGARIPASSPQVLQKK